MENIRKSIATLKGNEFPRSKLHSMVQTLISNNPAQAQETIDKTISSPDEVVVQSLKALSADCEGDTARWLHISNLWDYISEG